MGEGRRDRYRRRPIRAQQAADLSRRHRRVLAAGRGLRDPGSPGRPECRKGERAMTTRWSGFVVGVISLLSHALAWPATAETPAKIAVFAIEYEDFSAAASASGATASDTAYLDKAT